MNHPVETLREIWTPEREVEELVHKLDPQTELDSQIRDYLHRAVQQVGPMTLLLAVGDQPVFNTGQLRFEIIEHQPRPGVRGRREVSLWIID